MSLRKILLIPDPRLRQKAEPVAAITPELRALVSDMFETMYDAPGIGLAAPQIGVMQRLIVVDCAPRSDSERETAEGDGPQSEETPDSQAAHDEESAAVAEPDPIAMINPEITWFSEERSTYEEGCLSIPDYYEEVERPAACRVRYMDLEGQWIERDLDGLLSTCVQHEVDHLNGKLFIDYLSRLKRERITKKFKKAARLGTA